MRRATHGVTNRQARCAVVRKNFLAGDVEFQGLVFGGDSQWACGLHEPRTLRSHSCLAIHASLLLLHRAMAMPPRRRAIPAIARSPIRIASPHGVAAGAEREPDDVIIHLAYWRVVRRAHPGVAGRGEWTAPGICWEPRTSARRVCEGSPICVAAPTTHGAPSCALANFVGRDHAENPQRQPESFSSCRGATLPARPCQGARQTDTRCTAQQGGGCPKVRYGPHLP